MERGCHPLYPLVPAHDRRHGGKARQLHRPRRATAGSSWSFPARSWSGASRTPPPSPPAACGPPLRPGAIPPGIPPPLPLSRRAPSASPPFSAPTAARRWTKRRRCCAPWRMSARQAIRILRLFGDTERQQGHPLRGPGAGVLPGGPGAVLTSGEDLRCTRPHPVRRQASQGAGAGRPLFRRHPPPGGRLHEGPGRGAVEAGHLQPRPSTTRWPPPSTRWPRFIPTPTSPATTTS